MRYSYCLLIYILLLFFSCERIGKNVSDKTNESVAEQEAQANKKPTDYDYKVRVIRISDGDTFVGKKKDGTEFRYRLYGIDAPEKKQAFSNKATQKLSELISNREVEIIVKTKSDRYGRPIVIVKNKDGLIANEELLKYGLAWHYKYYSKDTEYATLERLAQIRKIGLWQQANPTAPWNYRRSKKTKNNSRK